MRHSKWTRTKVIEALIAFYRAHKRFPYATEKGEGHRLYNACYYHIGGLNPAIKMANEEIRKRNGEPLFSLPCGELDEFFTKCYHKRSCANGHRCPIAVNGSGHPQAAMNMAKTEFI